MMSILLSVFSLFILINTNKCCESPQLRAISYSITDARLTVESATLLEITILCKTGKQPNTLYADIYGQIIPCAESSSYPGRYYVSVATVNYKNLKQGLTIVKLYNDDAYSALRKARTDEAMKSIKTFGEVEFYYPGTSYGPWLASEFIAVIAFGIIWWFAYRERSKILA